MPNPEQQAAANHWLTAFQRSDDAWAALFQLLAAGEAQEVQFFAASLLVRKVRSDWGRLDVSMQPAVQRAAAAKLDEVLGWQGAATTVVLRQVCLLQAAVCGAGGGEGCRELVFQALTLIGRGSDGSSGGTAVLQQLGLELLSALAEEAEMLEHGRRSKLVTALLPHIHDVLSAAAAVATAGDTAAAAAAFRCAAGWLGATPVAGSSSNLTPGQLHAQHPQLLAAALSAPLEPAPGPAAEAAVQLLLGLYGNSSVGAVQSPAERGATLAAAAALASARERLAGAGPDDALPLAVAQLGSALAERDPELCAGQQLEVGCMCASQGEAEGAFPFIPSAIAIHTSPLTSPPHPPTPPSTCRRCSLLKPCSSASPAQTPRSLSPAWTTFS
jgi:hypothetical protein